MHILWLPFNPRFRTAMLTEVKTTTTRTQKYGSAGDTFTAFGKDFVINNVGIVPISYVRDMCWQKEGFESAAEFELFWDYLHKIRLQKQPDRRVFLHEFKLIKETEIKNAKEA